MSNLNTGVLDGLRRIGARLRDVTLDGGIPGAPLGYRIRGATQSGPPRSGTWKAGDHIEDRAGSVWICTKGGTPGTWTAAGDGLNGTWHLDSFAGTDDQKMTSALAAWSAAGTGGTIVLSNRAHTFTYPWITTYGGSSSTPAYLRITGAGAGFNGMWSSTASAAVTKVTFTCTSVAACIQMMHLGSIELDHMWIGNANTGVPLVLVTNATPDIHHVVFSGGGSGATCTTDAVYLGGTGSGFGAGTTAQYQGYQGAVTRNFFDGIQRAVLWQQAANAVVCEYNTVSATCGTSYYGGAPFELNGPTDTAFGNFLVNNCVECTNYYYLARVLSGSENTLGPNGAYDQGSKYIAAYQLLYGSTGNNVYDGGTTNGAFPLVDDRNPMGSNSVLSVAAHAAGKNITLGSLVQFTYNGAPPQSLYFGENVMGVATNAGMGLWVTTANAIPGLQAAYRVPPSFTDGAIVNGSQWLYSTTAAFAAADVGQIVAATGISSLTQIASVYTASTLPPWQASSAYTAGTLVRPTTANTYLYQCSTAGTTGSSAPTWPTTAGLTVTDGTAVWTCLGTGTAALLNQPATATTNPLTFAFSRLSAAQVLGLIIEGPHLRAGPAFAATAAAGANAGTGASTAGSLTADLAGLVNLTTGTGPSAGAAFSVTFGTAYGAAPVVTVVARNSAAAALLASGYWVVSATGSFTLELTGTPAASTSYLFGYHAMQPY